jgi:hypothetical protein
MHRYRRDDRQPGARARETRNGGIEQADGWVEVARKEPVERRPTVEAVEQDRRIGIGGPALAPAVDETTVVVGRRLGSDAAARASY